MSMGKRARKGGEEMDVFSGWRYLLGYTNWAGLVSGVKKRVRRRERRQARQKGYADD